MPSAGHPPPSPALCSPGLSVQHHLAGVQVVSVGSCVGTAEFLEAGSATQPGLTKASPAHEEKGARARVHATAQWGVNGGLPLAPGASHPENRQRLAEDAGSCHGDDRLL